MIVRCPDCETIWDLDADPVACKASSDEEHVWELVDNDYIEERGEDGAKFERNELPGGY